VPGEILLLTTIGASFAGAAVGALASASQRVSAGAARAAVVLVALGFASALGLAVRNLTEQPTELGIGSTVLRGDAMAVILAILVLGLSVVIQQFATRYLRGDARQAWFVVWANLLTGFTVVMVAAGSVATFAAGWIAAGICLVMLLGTYRHQTQAREGVRRAAVRFAIGDAAFLIAVAVLLISSGGDIRIDALRSATADLPSATFVAIGLLIALAALARSSQLPFTGWLPSTLAAPTPISALMHAGVVNAGAVLLIRFAPIVSAEQWTMLAIFVAGASTVVIASAVRLVKPDTKGQLVYSTMAQMGFMIMTCGLGAYAAALFHLIAHSLYKANLFLGAGMVVRDKAMARELPSPAQSTGLALVLAILLAVCIPVGSLLVAHAIAAPYAPLSSVALLGFVAMSGIASAAAILGRRLSILTVAGLVVVWTLLSFYYVLTISAVDTALGLDSPITTPPLWLLALPAAALVLLDTLRLSRAAAPRLRSFVYTGALSLSLQRPLPLEKGTTR
jgi:NAD(P)H-quinone oxidoreductase subunit 5